MTLHFGPESRRVVVEWYTVESAALTVVCVPWLAIVYFGAKFQHGPMATSAGASEYSRMLSVIRKLRL